MLPCRRFSVPRALLGAAERRVIRASALAPALALLAFLATPARAFKLTTIRPARDPAGQLWVEIKLENPLEPRVEKSLQQGMSATLTLHAELWRRRNGWFDRMERAVDATFRLRYEDWDRSWRLDRPGGPPLVARSIDSLETALERTLALPVSPLSRIAPDAGCYVAVTASLRPLSVEDVEEVEGWLSGEVRAKRRSGWGALTGIPRSLFEAARNFAGFGDDHSRLISNEFTPATLPPVSRLGWVGFRVHPEATNRLAAGRTPE